MRRMFCLALAAVGGAAFAQVQVRPLPAKVAPPGGGIAADRAMVVYTGPTAFQKTVNSQAVVAGTVTISKDTVDVSPYQGAPVKITYRVATVKVTDTLVGDKAETVKVLLGPSDPTYINEPFPGQPAPPYQPQFPNNIQLIDGQEGVFFLTRLAGDADNFILTGGCPPLNPLDTTYKPDLAEVKVVAAIYADPVKSLKAEKSEDRVRAASVLVSRYSRPPAYDGKQYPQVAVAAEETKLILKALKEADWASWDKPQQPGEQRDYMSSPANVLGQMQIYPGAQGKANFPQVRQQPGQGYHAAYKEAFDTWMEGAGKDYEIKRYLQPNEKK